MSKKSAKSSALRIRCYIDPAPILEAKASQIKRAIYILHSDDGKTPHYHINILLKQSRVPEEIRRWFEDCENKAWCDIDTGTFQTAILYYKHQTDDAIAEGKKSYSDSDIRFYKCSPEDIADVESDDCSYAILSDLVKGVPLMQIAEKYGKAFTRYYLSFRALASDIRTLVVRVDEDGVCYNELGDELR